MLYVDTVNPNFEEPIRRIKPIVDRLSLEIFGREAIVTSGNDGHHMPNSLHYKGLAMDLRTKDQTHEKITAFATRLQMEIGDDYDVIIEDNPPHIHVEYDPK